MMCGDPTIVSLLPGLCNVEESRPLPRQVRSVRVEDCLHDDNDDSPLEPWHMFARRQDFRGGSTVLLALQEDVARVSYPPFIPHRECCIQCLYSTADQQHQFFDTEPGTQSVFGQWALRVNAAIEYEDSVRIVGDWPSFPSLPVRQP